MKGIVIKEVANLILRPSAQKASVQPTRKGAQKKPSAAETHDLQRTHSQYYGIITANQMVFTPNDRDVAMQLLNMYFDMFKEILGEHDEAEKDAESKDGEENDDEQKQKKGRGKNPRYFKKKGKMQRGDAELDDSRSKLLSAILTGVNRAFPYAKDAVATDEYVNN